MNTSRAFPKLVLNPDGSLTRPEIFPLSPPNPNPPASHAAEDPKKPYVLSKDVPLNPSNNTWIRIFRPHLLTPTTGPLPIIIYFHGGGFILYSAASAPFHASCERIASGVPAIVLSVDYRLAPEHRLPAAYDDAIDAVRWVSDQAAAATSDPWMASELADFSRCFLMGSSAGGNIAFRAALQAIELEQQEPPLKIAGVILNQPYFGGIERTESEMRSERDPILPLRANDYMWELALPLGAQRDHEFCNAILANEGDGRVASLPACMVRGHGGDPLADRQRAMAEMLEGRGVRVMRRFHEGGFHAVELFDPEKADAFLSDVRDFVSSVSSLPLPPSDEIRGAAGTNL